MAAQASISLPLLDRVQVASPCDMRWEDMTGDERMRRCEQCSLNVYNLSAMPQSEAEALLARHFNDDGTEKQGRFCGQLFRRADGTVMTADCPVGLAAVRAKARRTMVRVAAAIGLTSLVSVLAAAESKGALFGNSKPISYLATVLRDPGQASAAAARGKIAMPGMMIMRPTIASTQQSDGSCVSPSENP
ncbi:MAG: hypothetical protein QM783_19815 [Phycisphaerales bacterium]